MQKIGLYIILIVVTTLILTSCTNKLDKSIDKSPREEVNNNIDLKEDFIEVKKKECKQNLQKLGNLNLPNINDLEKCLYKDTIIGNENVKLWLYTFTVLSGWDVVSEREILIFERSQDNSFHKIEYNHHKLSAPLAIRFASIGLKETGKELSWACFMEEENPYFMSGTTLDSDYKIDFEKLGQDIYANIDVNYLITKTGCLITGNHKHSITGKDHLSEFTVLNVSEFWVDSCDLLDDENADKCRCSALLFSDGGTWSEYLESRLPALEKIKSLDLKTECETEFKKMYEEQIEKSNPYFLPDEYEEMYEEILPILKHKHVCKVLNQQNLSSSKLDC